MAYGLEIERVSVCYGAFTAVDDMSFSVAPGEIFALLGESGSGKSSLLRGIAGLEPLASGAICWNGTDLVHTPTHLRGFVLMFQDGQLFPHLDVAGNSAYGINQLTRRERETRTAELLALVGLEGYGKRRITELSGGQAQRVALARSLAPRPRMLLLDEPLSSLDKGLRERLVGELATIIRDSGIATIYVTHDDSEAFALADRIGTLKAGRLLHVTASS
jgi:thiamine transport system ATP-binding protein